MPTIKQLALPLALASAAALPGGAQAAARYHGKTRHGDPIAFTVKGSRITNIRSWVPTLCLPTEGLPMVGTDAFDPPGSFVLGRRGDAHAKRRNTIWVTSDVTKHFTLSTVRGRGGRITGKLHVDYSFLQLLFTYPISARPYVCTGDSTFSVKPGR